MKPTTNDLRLAKDLTVPRAIAARTVFVAGTKGSGKTHNAGVMVEEMLAAGVHACVLDPLGVWWGLRHDAGGGAGGLPVVILGGEHGDRPLLPTAGDIVADYLVRSGQSVILDMSGFDSDAEQDRFVTAFLKRLFRLKAADKAALHLVMDEADLFAPNQPQPGQQVMLGATKTIVTKARSRGLSMTMITQRPQSIATVCRDEADVFLCHRIQGPRAAAAVRDWVEQHASRDEVRAFMDSLATLDTGECWVWSPHFLKLFRRVRFRPKATFDSSRTPDPGEAVRQPKAAAAVDLDKLTTEMEATAEQAKANDPAALKRRIAELEKVAAAKPAAPPPAKVERVEVPVLKPGQLEKLDAAVARLQKLADAAGEQYARAVELRDGLAAAIRPATAAATVTPRPAPAPARPAPAPAART
ncbi:MAG: hypothetical protein JWO31_4005, partial [Phycisphaerales bacterium]|nr:hypothetical protein [Phycisphaerales bacterium]